jgi:TrmH family RNA methyltransferase
MTTTRVESAQNAHFKSHKELLSSRGIKEQKRFLVFGDKPILEILESNPEKVLEIIECDATFERRNAAITDEIKNHRIKTFHLSNQLFEELDVFGIRKDILVCEIPVIRPWSQMDEVQGIELLVPVGDPSNLGAVLRSALAFDAQKVVLLRECAHFCHPKSIRAAATNIFLLPLFQGPSIKELTSTDPSFYVLDHKGEDITRVPWPKGARLVVGEEGAGIPKELREARRVSIPMNESVESLNAAVAASIALFCYQNSIRSE